MLLLTIALEIRNPNSDNTEFLQVKGKKPALCS